MVAPLATLAKSRICCCVHPAGQIVSRLLSPLLLTIAVGLGELTPPMYLLWKNVTALLKPGAHSGARSKPTDQLRPFCGTSCVKPPPSWRRMAVPPCPIVQTSADAVQGVLVFRTTAP